MPRVTSSVKSKAGKELKCGRCGAKIEAGEEYFSWAFFRQAKQVRCKLHPPRRSELTQTNMSQAYAAVESVEDTIAKAREKKASVEDIKSALDDAASEVEGAKDAYQESYDNLPENFQNADQGNEMQEKIDALDAFHDTLEGASSDIDGIDDQPEEGETAEDKEEEVLNEAIDLAEAALQEFDQ